MPHNRQVTAERTGIQMDAIRVYGGITVEVNDYGDTITVPVEDQRFMDKLFNFWDHMEAVAAEMGSPEVNGMDRREQLRLMLDRTTELMADLDDMFGEGCCKKVFGDMVPGAYLIADFLTQLMPVMEKYMDERQKAIAQKYSGARKGARGAKEAAGR